MHHNIKKILLLLGITCILVAIAYVHSYIKIDQLTTEKRESYLKLFKDVTITRDKSINSSVLITTYNHNLINRYCFKKKLGIFTLSWDTLQYDTHVFDGKSTKLINDTIMSLLRSLDSLDILGVNSALRDEGIDLEVFLKNGALRLYIKDTVNIRNDMYKGYFHNARKISDNWYSTNN